MKFVIAGGTGSVGQAVAAKAEELGYEVIILTRNASQESKYKLASWDGKSDGDWGKLLAGSVLLNLSGELVDRRPTSKNIRLLKSSRVEPTNALVEAAKKYGSPKAWLQMSTLAIHGDAGEDLLTEDAQPADGPEQMSGVAKAWEEGVKNVDCDQLCILRTGIVLQRDSPALNRLVAVVRSGLGGRVGSGKQWISWIHVDDFVASIFFLLETQHSGVYHLTSPIPVRNVAMMNDIQIALGQRIAFSSPAWLIWLGSWAVIGTDPALALTGRKAMPKRLMDEGFKFDYPELADALKELT